MAKFHKRGPKVGDILAVDIHKLSREGAGIATVDGVDVHTRGSYPGERVEVKILARSRHHPRAHAKLRKLVQVHPDRRPSPCVHHPICSGCPLIELKPTSQRELKRTRASQLLGVDVGPLVHDPERELCYRHSSKRVAYGKAGELWLGSYRRDSHRGAGMRTCPVDHPKILAVAEELTSVANRHNIVPYDEQTQTGDLRYIWLRTDGARVVLTLVTATDSSVAAEVLPVELRTPAAVAWSVQPAAGNTMRGKPAEVVTGVADLTLDLGDDLTLSCGPLGFLQPNPAIAARAYRDLVSTPSQEPLAGKLAYDLYAGAGATTTLLRRNFADVVPCESYPESARALGVPPMKAEAFLAERRGPTPELVVANPPRGGMGARVCERLRELAAPRIQIMSCSAEALARDLEALCRDGAYTLAHVRAYDTLPQTNHLELVAWLEKNAHTS